jgi:mannose-6-phosphate isomerase-like protein (cupin superfamily)
MSLQHLSKFLSCFADALDRAEQPIARSHARRLRLLETGLSAIREVPRGRVPVHARCEAELALHARHSPLGRALLDLMPAVHLTRSSAYLADPPNAEFGDNYGYGVICGLDSGPPALISDSEIAFGLMLLGPTTHYPLHHHPADEIYHAITGPSQWRAGDEPWSWRNPGETVHHPPWVPHATLSGDKPLVVLYVWQGDLETEAAFLPDFRGADASLVAPASNPK